MTPNELYNTSVCVGIALGLRLPKGKGCTEEQLIKESLPYGVDLGVTQAHLQEYVRMTPVQIMASLPQSPR